MLLSLQRRDRTFLVGARTVAHKPILDLLVFRILGEEGWESRLILIVAVLLVVCRLAARASALAGRPRRRTDSIPLNQCRLRGLRYPDPLDLRPVAD